MAQFSLNLAHVSLDEILADTTSWVSALVSLSRQGVGLLSHISTYLLFFQIPYQSGPAYLLFFQIPNQSVPALISEITMDLMPLSHYSG